MSVKYTSAPIARFDPQHPHVTATLGVVVEILQAARDRKNKERFDGQLPKRSEEVNGGTSTAASTS